MGSKALSKLIVRLSQTKCFSLMRFKRCRLIRIIFLIIVPLLLILIMHLLGKANQDYRMLFSARFSLNFAILGATLLQPVSTQVYYPCNNEIYCYGELLHTAQFAYLYNDSKSFVDMHMNYEQDRVLEDFEALLNSTDDNPSANQTKNFVHDHFSPPDSEFAHWTPPDWKASPQFLNNIQDPDLKSWGSNLNARWRDLGRKIKDDVRENSSRYSIIYSPNPVIVPGGRFREFYYWDNYWIVRGLLLSEMYTTVKGSISNFLEMVKNYGFIPNGGRLYYTRRSQPPFLTLMVRDYVNRTGDYEFMEEALPTLELEYSFWEQNRTISVEDAEGKIHFLSRYASDVNQPRPESYREDYELVHNNSLNQAAKLELMTHVTSACESGWDFSTRWAVSSHEEGSNLLLALRTRDIIPVDLNSVLSAVERTLADFNQYLGKLEKADSFREKYRKRAEGMEKILWNEDDGVYYDYILPQKVQNRKYFISNVNPLWTKPYPSNVDANERERRMYQYLKTQTLEGTSVLDFPGGIPTSLDHSGQQWDFPNAWPPTVHIVIEGMHTSNVQELKVEAFRQSQKWIKTGWRGFSNPKYDNAMFEKYNVLRDDGLPGSGGEYEVQEGFGWTNGVAMILLDLYGETLTTEGEITTSTLLMTTSNAMNFYAAASLTITTGTIALIFLS